MWNSWSFFLPPYQRTFSGLPAMCPAGPFHHISLLKKIQKSLMYPENAFFNVGTIDDVIAKAKEMEEE